MTDRSPPPDTDRPSKTRRKQDMQELQSLGEELAGLSAERLARIDLPDALRGALREVQGMGRNEARRRQMQYIGKLMRALDAEPIRAALADVRGESAAEVARMHRLERLRTQLMNDERTLSDIAGAYPGADLQHLRALRRAALKEQELGKPPRSYRSIFQTLKALDAPASGAAPGDDDDDAQPADESR